MLPRICRATLTTAAGLPPPEMRVRSIDDAHAHVGDVAQVDGRAFAEHHDDLPHVFEARQFRRGKHEVLEVVLGKPADGCDDVGRPQCLGHLVNRQLRGVQAHRDRR